MAHPMIPYSTIPLLMENMQTKQALLVMDVQRSIVSSIGVKDSFLKRLQQAISHARHSRIPVFYVVVGFRTGMPEISPINKTFSQTKERMQGANMEAWMQIAPEVAPQDSEPIVIKRRVSAFTGSDLDVLLRAQGIQHLILTGIATSGVVLSTLREAADKDFSLTVLEDACADRDEEVHHVLMQKVFPRQADILNVAEWIAS